MRDKIFSIIYKFKIIRTTDRLYKFMSKENK